MKKVALLVCLIFAMSLAGFASGPPVDVPARARGAARIVIGTVTEVESRFDVNQWGDQLIVSDTSVSVEETLKGGFSSSVVVKLEGGTVGDLTLDVSDMPSMKKGDRAVFFLDVAPTGTLRPNGRGHGVLKLDASDRVEGSTLTVEDIKRIVRENR